MSKRFLSITLAALALCFFASSCVKEEGFENRVREIVGGQQETLVSRVDALYKEQIALNDSLKNIKGDVEKLSKQSKSLTDSIAAVKNSLAIQKEWTTEQLDALDVRVTAIEEAQDAFKTEVYKRLDLLWTRIQKIDVIPQYNDGSVWMSKKDTVVKFIVRPDSIAKKLAAAHPTGDSTFTFLAVKTLTKSDGNPDTLDIKEVSYKDGIVSVKVNGSKLDSLYFEGEQSYSGCLVIGDGNSDNASGFFPLYYVRADLSTNGTSNCYIVSKAGDYKIKATVKGNCADSVIAPSAVSVLWESFGTSTTPASGDLVKDITLSSNGYVYFSASEKKGNAVIAAKDGSGTILWSWHIWLTDQPGEQEYKNNAGTMMDRNLGATSADKGQVSALGLLYQWGRKDPFLGSSSKNSSILAASTLSWPSPENTSYHLSNNNALAYSISNPTTFLKNESTPWDWYCISATYKNDTLWNVSSGKTIYDPCPVGYRVPKGGSGGIWAKAGIPSKGTFDSTNKGMDFATYTTSSICWYPAAGFRNHGGSLVNVGTYAYYGSFTTKGNDSYCLYFFSVGGIYTSQDATRARGYSVRCVKE